MDETRQKVGIILRLPIVCILTVFWVFYIWPFIAAFTFTYLVFKPVFYIFDWICIWLWYAFCGSTEETILPDYWEGYPVRAFHWLKAGFPTLKRWLIEGWPD